MLDMGFRPAVDRIVDACPRKRQTLFFSATLDGVAGRVAAHYTRDAISHEHGATGTTRRPRSSTASSRSRATTASTRWSASSRPSATSRSCSCEPSAAPTASSSASARSGVMAAAIHGNRSQKQREQALAQFHSGHVDTLVATDVAARGIDVQGISHVINFDPPGDHDAYVHRIGRTGRAGRRGVGITLVGGPDRNEAAPDGEQAEHRARPRRPLAVQGRARRARRRRSATDRQCPASVGRRNARRSACRALGA